jgi:hypothetical protein
MDRKISSHHKPLSQLMAKQTIIKETKIGRQKVIHNLASTLNNKVLKNAEVHQKV